MGDFRVAVDTGPFLITRGLMPRLTVILSVLVLPSTSHAQAPALSPQIRSFVSIDSPVVALTNARVIDGTGRPAARIKRW